MRTVRTSWTIISFLRNICTQCTRATRLSVLNVRKCWLLPFMLIGMLKQFIRRDKTVHVLVQIIGRPSKSEHGLGASVREFRATCASYSAVPAVFLRSTQDQFILEKKVEHSIIWETLPRPRPRNQYQHYQFVSNVTRC